MSDVISLRRAFEVDNARNLNRDEVVSTFVPSEPFWRLLSPKNHIVLGARGSGKTALGRMLSHSHLAAFDDPQARAIIQQKQFVGIYVPARISWMGSHASRREVHTAEDLEVFVWKLNLATCFALVETVESCLNTYFPSLECRLRAEIAASKEMAKCWFDELECTSLRDIRAELFSLDFQKKSQITRSRINGTKLSDTQTVGLRLHHDLFDPLRDAIEKLTDVLGFPADTAWLLCLDEIEFLSNHQHKILNTYLREHSGNLYFKLTTMPYRHYTLETQMGVPLNPGHDFEYLYLDNHQIKLDDVEPYGDDDDTLPIFASRIFQKRLAASGLPAHSRKSLRAVFGPSRLLDGEREDWSEESANFGLIRKYCNDATVERATKLVRTDIGRFRDQIGRKIHGALLLKDAVHYSKGRAQLTIYSGATLIARCSDGNPRTFITIVNALLWSAKQTRDEASLRPVPPQVQTRVLTEYAGTVLRRIQGEEFGGQLYELIRTIGDYMCERLHGEKTGTDVVSSIEVDLSVGNHLSYLVKAAAGLGYLYPALNPKEPNRLPLGKAVFELGFVLAPHFKLLPRKGKPRDIQSIIRAKAPSETSGPLGSLL